MAGGPSTPGSWRRRRSGCAGLPRRRLQVGAAAWRSEIAARPRRRTSTPFGVNVFVPGRPRPIPRRWRPTSPRSSREAAALGVTLGRARRGTTTTTAPSSRCWSRDPPAAVSFTFGVPAAEVVRSLQAAGPGRGLTVTTPEEAARALRVGPDALCLQGAEAGAHRGSFANDDRPDQDRPLAALLASVRQRTSSRSSRPGAWAGPTTSPTSWRRGATWSRPGRRSCAAPRAGRPGPTRTALADRPASTSTAVTRAFSGRRARALVNGLVRAHPARRRPIPRSTTPPGRSAPRRRGRRPRSHEPLRGDGFRQAEDRPAGEIVARLMSGWRR